MSYKEIIEWEPLVVEQVITANGLSVSWLTCERQPEALGLVRCELPAWFNDLNNTFFTVVNVEIAAGRQHGYRECWRTAINGFLPASWTGFAPDQVEKQEQK